MPICFVPTCSTGYSTDNRRREDQGLRKLRAFTAPKDPTLLKQWQARIKRADKKLSPRDCVCELHFLESDIIRYFPEVKGPDGKVIKIERERCKLAPGAIPSVFDYTELLRVKPRKLPARRCVTSNEPQNATIEELMSASKETMSASKEPMSGSKEPENCTNEPENATIEEPMSASKESISGTKKLVSATKILISNSKESESATKKPIRGSKEPETRTKEPENATEKPVSANKKPISSFKGPENATRKLVSATKKPISGSKEPENATKKQISGSKEPENRTKEPEDPTKEPENATKGPENATNDLENDTKKPVKKPRTAPKQPRTSAINGANEMEIEHMPPSEPLSAAFLTKRQQIADLNNSVQAEAMTDVAEEEINMAGAAVDYSIVSLCEPIIKTVPAGNFAQLTRPVNSYQDLTSSTPRAAIGGTLKRQTRAVVYNTFKYFERKKLVDKNKINPRELTSQITGVSSSSVARIIQEANCVLRGPVKFTTPCKSRPHRKKMDPDIFDSAFLRNVIREFYLNKQLPTAEKVLESLKEDGDIDFGSFTLRAKIKESGFEWVKCHNNRKLLIERPEIGAWRARYLRAISKFRSDGRDIVYLGFVTNSMLVYKSKAGEYHSIMNFDEFLKWLSGTFLPNLPERSVVVLDNSEILNVELNKKPSDGSVKNEVVQWLTRNNVFFDVSMTKAELLELAKAAPVEKTYKVDSVIYNQGHEAIRLPPYHPDLSPVEMVWGSLKKILARTPLGVEESRLRKLFAEYPAEHWAKACGRVMQNERNYINNDHLVESMIEHFSVYADEGSSDSSDDSDS